MPRGPAVGTLIKRARLRAGLNQSELAEKIGVTSAAVSTWERHGSKPRDEKLETIEKVTGLRLKELKGGDFAGEVVEDSSGITPSTFAAWLVKARIRANLSAAELASKARVSTPTIYNIENGRIENPHPTTVKKIESALKQELPTEAKEEIKEEATIAGLGEFVDFDPHDEESLPEEAGVYVFYDISERPIYVGQGQDIRRRILDHKEKFWFKAPIVETASFVRIDDTDLRKKVETLLIKFLKANAVLNKQNVER